MPVIIAFFIPSAHFAGKLARYAREVLKLTTPQHKRIGGALITRSRVYELLKDPIYAGFFFYEGTKYELAEDLPRLITEEQRERILRILASKNIPKTKNHVLTFTGFIQSPAGEFIGQDVKTQVICDCKKKFAYQNKDICPQCDKLIIELEKPKYLEYKYYYNISRKKRGLKARTVTDAEAHSYLTSFFQENLELSPALLEWSKKYLHEIHDKEIETKRATALQEDSLIETAEKRKKKIMQLMADEQLSPADGKAMLDDLNKTIASKDALTQKKDWFEKTLDITDLLGEFLAIMQSDDTPAKRRILARLGSNLVWNEEKLSITNAKWANVLIEGLKEAKTLNPEFEPRNYVVNKDKTDVLTSVCPTLLRG